MKNYQKNPIYPFMLVSCMTKQLNPAGPTGQFDLATSPVDPTPPVSDNKQHWVTDQWTPLVMFDSGRPC